jgi:hypothetical protein
MLKPLTKDTGVVDEDVNSSKRLDGSLDDLVTFGY